MPTSPDRKAREPSPEGRAVGEKLRRLRTAAGLSLVELAARCAVSQPYLSQLERGIATPSITTLYTLADVLRVHPGQLLEPPRSGVARPGPDVTVTSAEQRQVVRVGEAAAPTAHVLVPGGKDALLEGYIHTFRPGDPDRDWFEHPGEDLLYVLEGSVELQLRGHDPIPLGTGQSAHHGGLVPHRCRALGDEPARTILVSVRDGARPAGDHDTAGAGRAASGARRGRPPIES